MANFFELANEYRELLLMLQGDEDIPQDQLEGMLDSSREIFEIKAANVAAVIKQLEMDASALKEITDKYYKRQRSYERKAELLRGWAALALDQAGMDEAGNKEHSLKAMKPKPSVIITDIEKIPQRFVFRKVIDEVDKTAVRMAIIDNKEKVPGVEIQYKKTVKVK